MSAMAANINLFLQQKNSNLQVSFEDEDSDYWRFKVHNHSVWPGVETCERIQAVQLDKKHFLYATSAPWKVAYHGTSVPNTLIILAENGFNNKHSGDKSHTRFGQQSKNK